MEIPPPDVALGGPLFADGAGGAQVLALLPEKPYLVAQVHRGLPFMTNDALVPRAMFDAIIDDRTAYGQGVAEVFKKTAESKGMSNGVGRARGRLLEHTGDGRAAPPACVAPSRRGGRTSTAAPASCRRCWMPWACHRPRTCTDAHSCCCCAASWGSTASSAPTGG